MSQGPLDELLDKLNSGDAAAAEQVFTTYEPLLRMVVHRQLPATLRPRFDSADIVQSVWADLLGEFRQAKRTFRDAEHLRAFLIRVTRNRFIDRLRQHRSSVERERTGADVADAADEDASRPSQIVQAKDLWQRMLAICPPDHIELLRLKRQGLSLGEIAERSGLHPSSVRRILYELARRLGEREAESPDRVS